MKRTVFFLLLVFLVTTSHSQNLVVNPGLETWTSATNPAGWASSEGCAMEATVRNSGVYSCMQTGGSTDSKNMNQTITVEPGKDYSFSVYLLTGASTTGNGGRIFCKWLNTGVDVTDETSKAIMQTPYLKNTSWQQYSFTVKAPPTATTFLLQVRTLSNSVTYWDDFVFQEGISTGIIDNSRTIPIIYPVPADDYLFIRNVSGIKYLEILDHSGTVFKSVASPGESEFSIYVGDLAEGLYILRIRYQGRVESRKFLKD